MDIVTLQLAKQYAKDSIQGAGALKGEKGEKGDPGPGLPPGGAVGQIPAKRSAVDYDVEWIDPPTGGGGGVSDHRLLSHRDAEKQHPIGAVEGLQAALAGKQDKLTPDESIALDGGEISVSLPTKAVTQTEYNALSEEEKRNGTLYMTSGAAFDGVSSPVPTGAVLSFLAQNAPYGYLICDGKEHPIAMYPRLAQYIREQFGETSHFGGDGETTFAVPDMRNLFLRGYHGEAEEQLSGEIGGKQGATEIPFFATGTGDNINFITRGQDVAAWPLNVDGVFIPNCTGRYIDGTGTWSEASPDLYQYYTSRPVNMAVLFCIKT